MHTLADIETATVPAPIAQGNFEILDRSVFALTPTWEAGVPNTNQGPPVASAWVTGQRYVDALGGEWACTAGGTPGTWKQIRVAVVAANPSGTIATGYVIARSDLAWTLFRWSGSAWVEVVGSVIAAIGNATGGATVDAEARTALNALLAGLRTKGILAP